MNKRPRITRAACTTLSCGHHGSIQLKRYNNKQLDTSYVISLLQKLKGNNINKWEVFLTCSNAIAKRAYNSFITKCKLTSTKYIKINLYKLDISRQTLRIEHLANL